MPLSITLAKRRSIAMSKGMHSERFPSCAAADDHSTGTSGDDEGGELVGIRGRLASLGSDPSSSHSRQHGSAGAGPARSAGADRDPRHISSALLQHASDQLHRHLDRGASGQFSSEQLHN